MVDEEPPDEADGGEDRDLARRQGGGNSATGGEGVSCLGWGLSSEVEGLSTADAAVLSVLA